MASGILFTKYHGCGNDFIVVKDLEGRYKTLFQDSTLMKKMCDRNFGIGGDALLHITSHDKYDFVMDDYTALYGTQSGLCGNGSRCGIQFAKDSGIIRANKGTFLACDGPHNYSIEHDKINIKLSDVLKDKIVRYNDNEFFVDVGSPHHVKFVSNIEEYDVMTEGRQIRFSDRYKDADASGTTGVNVNFAEVLSDDELRLRTYERTVGGETKACGTGSVSTAIAIAVKQASEQSQGTRHEKMIVNNGGNLIISFTEDADRFSNVVLSGPAQKVFAGVYFL